MQYFMVRFPVFQTMDHVAQSSLVNSRSILHAADIDLDAPLINHHSVVPPPRLNRPEALSWTVSRLPPVSVKAAVERRV